MIKTCLFCKIINKDIQSNIVYENDEIIVFKDISPKANTHLLITPKKHYTNLNDFEINDSKTLTSILQTIHKLGNLLENNHYKIQVNNGKGSGQEIFHLHFHFLSSSKLKSTGLS